MINKGLRCRPLSLECDLELTIKNNTVSNKVAYDVRCTLKNAWFRHVLGLNPNLNKRCLQGSYNDIY